MEKILIVDDDPEICLLLNKYFRKKGYDTTALSKGEEAVNWLKNNETDLVICDFKLPDYTGIEILQKIKIIDSKIQVIIITGYSDVRIAVEALRKGAYDYVTKPLYPDEILMSVKNALENGVHQQAENGAKKQKETSIRDFIVGISPQSKTVQKHVELIAPTDMSVIIVGETGTGKEYVARAIHQKSRRSLQPFVAVDCGALPNGLAGSELFGHVKGAFTGAINDKKGCFELANGGTLFLDEIGNLSYENQIQLLRVLQEQVVKKIGGTKDTPIDVRVLVATNENLRDAVKNGDFREDIYHRLNEFTIELAPLRDRPEDIELYSRHFLDQANEQLDRQVLGFDEETLESLKTYYWHGNLRELKNVIKRAVLLCQRERINADCLPPEIRGGGSFEGDALEVTFTGGLPASLKIVAEQAEKRAILEALKRTNNNKTKTAELLEVDRKTLYNKLKAYGINS